MGTTTSYQPDPYARDSSADVNAILQGMTDARIDQIQARRDQAQPQPAPQSASLQSAPLPPQIQPNYRPDLPPQVQPQPQPGQNYTVTGTGPGTWWRQQQQNQQNQPPIPPQFRQDQQPVPLQPRPQQQFSFYQPPQNSEQPPLNNMPPLWGGNQRGVSGLTKQQFLTQRMMHESQGDPTALNYVARGDPSGRAWDQGFTATGLLQDTGTTWNQGVKWALAEPDRYPMGGDDPRRYSSAGYAPWNTQWQVNSAVYDHMGETPWRERGGPAGNSFKARLGSGFYDSMSEPAQQYAPAQPRSFAEWGRAPQGMGQPGQMPRHTDFGRIFSAVAPLMVGIASLAMRFPLSTAITAYSAMTRAQQNGQREEYQRNRTKFQDQLKEATAQQALESREAGDAFIEYGNNNPQGLQQQLAQIALKYNDPTMFRMAEQGDLNGIHRLQQRRDLGNQDLTKLHKAQEDEQLRQDRANDVAARDAQWERENPNATPEQRAIAHARNQGLAERDIKGTGQGGGEGTGATFNVVDKDGKPTGQQVIRSKEGGYIDPNTNEPVQLKPGEKVAPLSAKPAKIAPANPYVNPDQQQDDDVTAQPDQQPQQDQQPDQQQPPDQPPDQSGDQPGDQGAASQAPAGPTRSAAAPPQPEQPSQQAQAGSTAAPPAAQAGPPQLPSDPYQVAQAGPDVPPPPTRSAGGPARAAPQMGPNMSRLNEDGRRLARDYATNGNEALQDVPAAFRAPLINAGQELRGEMQDAAQNLSGDALDKRLHQIDPTFADYLKGVSTYNFDLPTPGRNTSAGRIMALSVASKLNPNFNENNFLSQRDFRRPGGRVQQTLSRAAIMAESGRQVREYLKALPADPGMERWQRNWDAFVNGQLVGDHRYSDLFVALRQYIQEANVLVRGGQESVTETGEQLGTRGEGGGIFGGAAFAMPKNATPGMILGLLKTDARNTISRMDNFRNQWRQQDGHGEMPGDDRDAYRTFQEFGNMDVDKEAGIASDSDIDKFLNR